MIKTSHRQGGFAYIAAIVVCVVLAALATAAVRLGTTQQTTLNQDYLSARAWQAARAGTEWGAYQAIQTAAPNNCQALSTLTALNGFTVNVQCQVRTFNEGESAPGLARTVNVYQITATACNAAACPSNQVTSADYTERSRVISVCTLSQGVPC